MPVGRVRGWQALDMFLQGTQSRAALKRATSASVKCCGTPGNIQEVGRK